MNIQQISIPPSPSTEAVQQLLGGLAARQGGGAGGKKGIVDSVEISDQANILLQKSKGGELSEEEQQVVQEMKQRDQEVRSHEQSHKTVGGAYAGAIQLTTQTGPDGREYAVAGEVPIDASPVRDNPEATIRKMDTVIRAALAPADPSPQDTQVAQAAQQAKIQAQAELLKQSEGDGDDEGNVKNSALETALEQEAQQDEDLDIISILFGVDSN